MKREIKFKIWYKDGRMTEPFTPNMFHRRVPSNISDCGVLLQCTGLLDKNGKEIYEGDIVRFDERVASVGVVVYDGDSFKAKMPAFEIYWKLLHKGTSKKNRVEVIGNIYENPELVTP